MKKITIVLIALLFSVFTRAQNCSQLLSGSHQTLQFQTVIESIRNEKRLNIQSAPVVGITLESLNILGVYYKIVDPSRVVQDMPNREFYLIPFSEDRRLNPLDKKVRDKMLSLIESRLFKPYEALRVAKFLLDANADLAVSELIKLRLDELVLLNLKKQVADDKVQTNPKMKLSQDERDQISRYLAPSSRLTGNDLPQDFAQIDEYLSALGAGNFINSFLRRYIERIYSPL